MCNNILTFSNAKIFFHAYKNVTKKSSLLDNFYYVACSFINY
jgi:hypothetical protein